MEKTSKKWTYNHVLAACLPQVVHNIKGDDVTEWRNWVSWRWWKDEKDSNGKKYKKLWMRRGKRWMRWFESSFQESEWVSVIIWVWWIKGDCNHVVEWRRRETKDGQMMKQNEKRIIAFNDFQEWLQSFQGDSKSFSRWFKSFSMMIQIIFVLKEKRKTISNRKKQEFKSNRLKKGKWKNEKMGWWWSRKGYCEMIHCIII